MNDPDSSAVGLALAAGVGAPLPDCVSGGDGGPVAVRLPGPTVDNRFARLPDGFFTRVQPAQPEIEVLAALPPDWAAQLEVSCSS